MSKVKETIELEIPNLAFKELRKTPATGVASYPLPNFDVVNWVKNVNNNYGPNYMIDSVGNIYSVLPKEYHGNGDIAEEDRHNLIVFKADTKEAQASYEALVASLTNKMAKEEKPIAERSEAISDRKRSS